jgi:signal transduction histidine kinase
LSHELRTPVSAILLCRGAARSRPTCRIDALDTIVGRKDRARIVDDLLDLAISRSAIA